MMFSAKGAARLSAGFRGRTHQAGAMVSFFDLLDAFPSLSDAPRELEQLSAWFDGAGPTEQATHAAALVLELAGASEVVFSEPEALHVWDARHQAAYKQLRRRIAAEGLEPRPGQV